VELSHGQYYLKYLSLPLYFSYFMCVFYLYMFLTPLFSPLPDAIRDMNEKLKAELMHLDGEIHHHQVISHHRPAGYNGMR